MTGISCDKDELDNNSNSQDSNKNYSKDHKDKDAQHIA